MISNTYKYRATHFTGANVSIMIGPHLLTQCFAIDWQLNQSKRPIYGYNDQYYSGLSNGVVLVTGQLHVNFVHDGYLSTVLQKYYVFQNRVREAVRNGDGADLIDYISTHESISPLVNVIRDAIDPPLGMAVGDGLDGPDYLTYQEPGVLNRLTPRGTVDTRTRPNLEGDEIPNRLDLNMSNSDRTRAIDQALNLVFEDETIQEDLIQFFTGGVNSGGGFTQGENGETIYEGSIFDSDRLRSQVERNKHEGFCGEPGMVNARPDQFGSASSSPYGIDIVVHFGPPYGTVDQNQIYNYSNRSSFVLRDVSFIGEAGRIAPDDQPILETYNFVARKKETLVRVRQESNV